MRDKKESQKQKRIVKRQEKANAMLNKAISSGNLKKEERVIKKVKKLQTKYKDAGDAKRKVFKTNENGVKQRQVSKNEVVKKTVTRTKGSVEKEIERGNKRIDVRKYKDEGVKTRTVTNMKKAAKNAAAVTAKSLSESAIKGAISGSAFRNLPSSMVKEAMKPDNNVIMNKIMKATDNAMKEYGVEKIKNKK